VLDATWFLNVVDFICTDSSQLRHAVIAPWVVCIYFTPLSSDSSVECTVASAGGQVEVLADGRCCFGYETKYMSASNDYWGLEEACDIFPLPPSPPPVPPRPPVAPPVPPPPEPSSPPPPDPGTLLLHTNGQLLHCVPRKGHQLNS
jgi:hypothetical protein